MSLIDGIGDEVTQFLLAIVLVVIVVVAWWSTDIIRDPRSTTRSVYLLDYRIRMVRDQRVYISSRPISLQYNRQNNRQIHLENNTSTDNIQLEDPIETNTSSPLPDVIGETAPNPEIISTETESNLAETQAEQERTSIIRVMDADETEVRRRRIAFFAGRRSDGSSQEIASNAASCSIPPEQSATAQTEQRVSDDSDEDQEHEDDEEPSLGESNVFEGAYDRELDSSIMEHNYAELPIIDNRTITIKLKYTNDDMKIVTGKLQERIGDFKLRHFNDEYSSDRSVRLIFNGKILNDDDKTISSCGIFHNCVVHCLVMQGRREERPRSTAADFSPGESADGASRNTVFVEAARHAQFVRMQQQNAADRNGQQRQQREWNLGTLFSRCTNLLLVCAWYLRYSVPHIWTMTATLCLVALTGFSLVAHVSIFMPNGQAGEQANIRATRIDRQT